MPTDTVKKYAERAGVTLNVAEGRWEQAKEKAKENKDIKVDSLQYWSYVMGIYKKMMGIS